MLIMVGVARRTSCIGAPWVLDIQDAFELADRVPTCQTINLGRYGVLSPLCHQRPVHRCLGVFAMILELISVSLPELAHRFLDVLAIELTIPLDRSRLGLFAITCVID